MEVQVLEKRENALLHRTEVQFKAIHRAEPTPSRDSLRTELAKQLQASKDRVLVDRAASSFGRYETLGYAKVYRSKEEALAVERPYILVRNRLKEEEAKGEKPPKAERAEKPPKVEKPPKAEKPVKAEAPKAEAKKPEGKKEAAPAKETKPAAEKKEEKPAKAPPKKKEGK